MTENRFESNHIESESSAYFNEHFEDKLNSMSKNEMFAFTDGSYREGINKYGIGAVVITKADDNSVHIDKISKYGTDPDYLAIRNVAGEMLAVQEVVSMAVKQHIKRLHIYYDYVGIEEFYNGDYTARSEKSLQYIDFMNHNDKFFDEKIKFSKVKSHTGIKYNEEADQLANKAIK